MDAKFTYWTHEFRIPEWFPPPRVEAWLNLPPGVVVARDECDGDFCRGCDYCYEPYEPAWLGPAPRENTAVARRFRAEFGEAAAYAWGMASHSYTMNRVMKEVFCSERMQEQFYDSGPFLNFDKPAIVPVLKKV